MRSLLFYLSIMLMAFAVFSQVSGDTAKVTSRTIKGQVLDESGEPFIAASVINEARKDGTISDFDGKFSIKAEKEDSFTVSFYGYVPLRQKADQSDYRIVLKRDSSVSMDDLWIGDLPIPRPLFKGDLEPKMPQPCYNDRSSWPHRTICARPLWRQQYIVLDGVLIDTVKK